MQDIIPENTSVELVATAALPEPATEQKLADEIKHLWTVHVETQTTVKKTEAELEAIRQRLGERLHRMKQRLARPGRNDRWPSFLRSEGIARSTAERLVRPHEASVGPQPDSAGGQVGEPTDADVERFFDSYWFRMRKRHPTRQGAYDFLLWYVENLGLAYEAQAGGILVIDPTADSPGEPSGAAVAPAPSEAAAGGGDGKSGVAIR